MGSHRAGPRQVRRPPRRTLAPAKAAVEQTGSPPAEPAPAGDVIAGASDPGGSSSRNPRAYREILRYLAARDSRSGSHLHGTPGSAAASMAGSGSNPRTRRGGLPRLGATAGRRSRRAGRWPTAWLRLPSLPDTSRNAPLEAPLALRRPDVQQRRALGPHEGLLQGPHGRLLAHRSIVRRRGTYLQRGQLDLDPRCVAEQIVVLTVSA